MYSGENSDFPNYKKSAKLQPLLCKTIILYDLPIPLERTIKCIHTPIHYLLSIEFRNATP